MSCLKFAHMIPPKAHEEISKTFQGASFSDFKFLSGMSALDSDGNIFTRQKFLHIADGVGAKMENARGEERRRLSLSYSLKFFGGREGQAAFAVEQFLQPPVAGTRFAHEPRVRTSGKKAVEGHRTPRRCA